MMVYILPENNQTNECYDADDRGYYKRDHPDGTSVTRFKMP